MKSLPNIFVVDDDSLTVELVTRILKKNNYPVVGNAISAEKALKSAPNSGAELLLIDVRLADSSGIDLAKKINEIFPVGVIFVTGLSDHETVEHALEADYTYGIVYKPFKAHDLLSQVRFAQKRIVLERELRNKNAQIKSIFDASNDPMMIVDADTNEILDWNKAASEILTDLTEGNDFASLAGIDAGNIYEKFQSSGIKGLDLMHFSEGAWANLSVISCEKVIRGSQALLHIAFKNGSPGRQVFRRINLLESAINASRDLVCVTNAELDKPGPVIEYVNPAFCEATGYTEEELLGKTPRILQGPRTDRAMMKLLKESLKAGKPFQGSTVNYKKDKTPYYVEWSITPVRNEEGDIINFLSVQRDVTAKLEQERAIQLQKNRLQNIVEGTNAGTWEWDLETSQVDYNEEFARILGYELHEIENNSKLMAGMAHPEDFKIVPKNIDEHLSGKTKDFAHEVRMKTKRGDWVWCMFRGKVVERDSKNRPKKLAGILLNVNDQKNAQIELERIKDFLDETNKVALVGGYEFDLETGVLIWSSVTRQIHEVPEDFEPSVETALHFYKEGQSRDLIQSELERLTSATEESLISCEVEIVTFKGNKRWVKVRGQSEFKNGKCIRIHGAIQDIDQQKKAQNELVRTKNFLDETNAVAQVGGWEVNLLTGVHYWSDITKKILEVEYNYVPNLETGLSFYKEGENRNAISKAVQSLIENGESYQLELQVITGKGNEKWIRTRGEGEFVDGKCVRIYGVFQDINERKKARNELIRTKEFLAETNSVAQVGGWEVNFETNIHYWSKITRKIHEVDEDYIPSMDTAINFYKQGESRQAIQDAVNRLIETGETYQLELTLVTANGNERWIRTKGEAEFRDGKCVRIFGAIQDIHDQKLAALELERTKDFLSETSKVARVGGYEITISTGVIYLTDMAKNILEWNESAELTLDNHLNIYKPEFRENVAQNLTSLIEGQVQNVTLEVQIITETGLEKWVQVEGMAEFKNGICKRVYGALHDIDGRKRAELALEQEKQRFQNIVDGTNAGTWEWEFATKQISYNQKYSELTGYTKEELGSTLDFGGFWRDKIHPQDYKSALAHLTEGMNHPQGEIHFETRLLTKQLGWRWFLVSGKVVEFSDGKPISIAGILLDIHESKQIQTSLVRRQKISEAIIRVRESILHKEDKHIYFARLLNDIIDITDSEYGFIGDVLFDEESNPYLKTHALTNISWNEETRKLYEESQGKGMEFRNLNTLFGQPMKTGQPIITNEPSGHPQKGGIPHGHPSLDAFMGVPIIYEGEMLAMFGIANRPDGYHEAILSELQPLIETIGQIIDASNKEKLIFQKEEERKQTQYLLESFINASDDFIVLKDEHGKYVLTNQAFCEYSRKSKKEILGKTDFEILPEDLAAQCQISDDNVFETGKLNTTREHDAFGNILETSKFLVDLGSGKKGIGTIIRNVTQRVRMETEIKDSEARLKRLTDSISGMLVTYALDPDGTHRVSYISKGVEELCGLKQAEVVENAELLQAKTHPDDVANIEEALRRSATDMVPFEVEWRFINDGKEIWVSAIGNPIRLEDGSTRWYTLILDISEQKKLTQALQDSEKKYREMIELMSEGLIIHGPDDSILECNEAAARILGLTKRQLLGLDSWHPRWRAIREDGSPFRPEDHPSVQSSISGKPVRSKIMGVHKNDKEFAWILVNSQPVFDSKTGELKSVLVSFADFTEIKEAERQIEESEKRYRLLFDSNPLPMWLFDNKTLNFLEVNEAATDKYGFSRDEFLNMTIKDIRPEDDLPGLEAMLEKSVFGINRAGTWKHITKNKDVLHVDVTSYRIKTGLKHTTLVVANDVTEKYIAEKKLEESEQKLNSIIQNATDAIITINEDHNIVMFNKAAETIFGYEESEILGQDLGLLMPKKAAQKHSKLVNAFEQSADTARTMNQPGEVLFGVRKSGQKFPIETMISKVNVDGKILFTAIVRDITERLEAERKIVESHEFLRKLTDRVAGAVYQFERTDDGVVSFPYISEAITQLHPGLTVEQIKEDPSSIFNQIHPEDIDAVNASIAKSAETMEMWMHEYRVVRADGDIDWHKATAYPERGEGKIVWYGFVQETTQEVENRQRLMESEKRFRNMADSAPVLIWVSDTTKLVFYVNKRWTDYTGRTFEEELGNGWAEKVHPEDFDRCLHTYESAFERQESFHMEYRLLSKDGEYRWFNDHGEPRFTDEGEFLGYIGSCTDINDRVNVEEMLEEQKEQLRTIIDNIPDCIYVKDRNFRKILVNKAEIDYSGHHSEFEVLGKTDADLYGDYNGQKSVEVEQKIINDGYWFKDQENVYNNNKGGVFHFLTTKVPLRNKQNEIVGIIGIGKDISHRKEMELKLARQNMEFEAIFNAIPDLYFRISKDGVFKNYYAGQQDQLMFAPSDFLGKKLEDILPSHVAAPSYEAISNVLSNRGKYQFEYSLETIDGEKFYEANYYALTNDEVVAVVREITDKRKAEISLKLSQNRLQALIDSQTNFVLRTDLEGKVTYANPIYLREFGWLHGDGIPNGTFSLVSIMDYHHEKVLDTVNQCIAAPLKVFKVELDKPGRDKNLKVRTTLWDFICLTDEHGKPSEIQCMGIDISDRVEALRALEASEVRFRNLAENAPMFIAVHRKDYSSEYLNRAWREFFELEDHNLEFKTVEEHLHPDELDFSIVEFKKNLDAQIPFQMEYRLRNREGQYRWILNHIVPVFDEKNEYNGFLSTATDITFIKEAEIALMGDNERLEVLVSERTEELQKLNQTLIGEIDFRKKLEKERRKAQEQLAETHRQLKSITENITEVVYRSTPTEIVYANPSMAIVFGYTSVLELLETPVENLYENVADRDGFLAFVKKEKSWSNKEMIFRKKDGTTFIGLISGAAIFDRQNQIQYIDGTIRDITEIKAAQVELLRKERDLSQAQQMAKLGNWTLTLSDGSEKIVWDSVHYRSVGMDGIHPRPYSREFLSLVHPQDKDIIDLVAHDAITKGYSEFEVRLVDEQNKTKYVAGIIRKNVEAVSGESLFAVSRDVTKEREAEMELEMARQKAEKMAEAKQQFLASMSHEIRTPINGIRGMTFLLQHSALDNVQKAYINSIYRSSDHLLGIVNEILDFSKLDSKKIEYEQNDFELRDIINSVANMVGPKLKDKGLSITQSIDTNIGQFVIGDSMRFTQILTNLFDNAIKFTEAGQILVNAVIEREEKEKIWIKFQVEDTGIGIEKDRLEAIFDMFSQSDSSITRRYGGTGLGLAIVKKLCEQQGGTLRVDSEPGEGSVFEFVLPFGKSKVKSMRKEVSETDNYEKGRKLPDLHILVVDDNATNRLWVNKVLQMWGAKADEAENGKIALEKSHKISYDAILMDIYMPEMDGLEATKRIRDLNAHYKKIPIIGLTADVLNKDSNRYTDAGMDTCLGKPFNPQDLFNLLYSIAPKTGDKEDATPKKSTKKQAQKSGSKSLLNFEKLDTLADGDIEFKLRIINEMKLLMSDSLPKLKKAMETHDLEECRQIIHKLKPNTEYLGVHALFEMAQSFLQGLRKLEIKSWEEAELKVKEMYDLLYIVDSELQELGGE